MVLKTSIDHGSLSALVLELLPSRRFLAGSVSDRRRYRRRSSVPATGANVYINADLSDYFYVWLRRSLKTVLPDLFATLTVPKAEELVATPFRHGGRQQAEAFFLHGMTRAMNRIAEHSHPAFPVTIYYAFKQAETDNDGDTSSTGGETFLDAVMKSGFTLVGTWPMRTERPGRI
jgi:putative DNA methylase